MQVNRSKDWRRIDQLPRRDVISEVIAPGLLPAQNEALTVLKTEGALIADIPVGGGKTLITAWAPEVVGADRSLLLVPANLVKKTLADFDQIGRGPEVRSHSWASLNEIPDLDLLIIDEADAFGSMTTARGRRLIAWRKRNPEATCAFLTGTMIEGAIKTISFLSLIALLDRSPFPTKWNDTKDWEAALDARPMKRIRPGALVDWSEGSSLDQVRRGVMSRLKDSPGVYISDHVAFDGDLEISWIKGPEVCKDVIDLLHEYWTDHTGRDFDSPAELWARIRQAEMGYGYRLEPRPSEQWTRARLEWNKFVSSKLGSKLKSPGEVQRAYPDQYKVWKEIKDSFKGVDQMDLIDPAVIEWAWKWAQERSGIVWTEHARPDFGRYFGRGDEEIRTATGPCFASTQVHGRGKNLVQWSEMLVLTAPSSGKRWEQLIGRLHRAGQRSKVVVQIRDTPANRRAVRSALLDSGFRTRGNAKLEKIND